MRWNQRKMARNQTHKERTARRDVGCFCDCFTVRFFIPFLHVFHGLTYSLLVISILVEGNEYIWNASKARKQMVCLDVGTRVGLNYGALMGYACYCETR